MLLALFMLMLMFIPAPASPRAAPTARLLLALAALLGLSLPGTLASSCPYMRAIRRAPDIARHRSRCSLRRSGRRLLSFRRLRRRRPPPPPLRLPPSAFPPLPTRVLGRTLGIFVSPSGPHGAAPFIPPPALLERHPRCHITERWSIPSCSQNLSRAASI